jgi:hypothetical protein
MPEFGRLALDAEDRFHLLAAVVPVVHIIEISICELAMMERTQPSSGEASTGTDGARHVGEVRIGGDD